MSIVTVSPLIVKGRLVTGVDLIAGRDPGLAIRIRSLVIVLRPIHEQVADGHVVLLKVAKLGH